MRPFFLVFALLPLASQAQLFNKFEPGSYVLNDSRAVRHEGELKLRDETHLLFRDASGKTLKFSSEQVSSCRIGSRRFRVVGDFRMRVALSGLDVGKVFVEQLDSGQVLLMRHTFQREGPMSMGAGGMMTGGSGISATTYLLQWPDEETATSVQGGFASDGGRRFRDALRPYLVARPEMMQLLDAGRITTANLEAAIRALNHQLPFNPPTASAAD